MAENTYKKPKNTPEKKNRRKGEPVEEVKEPRKPLFSIRFVKDRRFQLVAGFFVLIFSLCMTLSFVSYLFTGTEDQSVVEAFFGTTILDSGKEAQNMLGLTGAILAYFFIFKWFGLASFLFIPIVFLFGFRIVFERDLINLPVTIKTNAFFILWTSFALGYIVLKTEGEANLSFLSGGVGYVMAEFSDALIGWATPLLIILLGIAFVIFFFNITTFNITPDVKDAETILPKGRKVPVLAEEEETEETEEEETTEEEEEEEEEQEEEAEDATQEWEVKVVDKENKKPVKKDLELVIEEMPEEELITVAKTPEPVSDVNTIVVDDKFVEPNEEDIEKNFEGPLENYDPTLDLPHYKYPTLDLLNEYDVGKTATVTKEELEANKDRIVDTLKNYSIGISSIKATIGPTVTLYEIVPDAGVRISKIKSLEDDIALSLSALGIRIIAPMPGKGTIGIEVPNKNKEMVSARSVFSTEKFISSDRDLPVVFGKTISNEIFIIDLAKMPHLLMAGATGMGKSVGLNILLASLLYKKHPSQLKFVLVDPKKVELSIYNTIERHFLAKLPDTEEAIITDTKKVVHTLNSLCVEMDARYDLLKEAGCRNLKEYNKKFIERRLNPNNGHRFMPYIVLVIDELADLMMTAGKEVETPIARLAQLARAIGIHLVVATQRPSVNVITGIIKANFPARLSFKVTSKIDSRTILDASGAEQLIGQGDMLFSQGSDVIRLQCAFVDTPEVDRICEFIGGQKGYSTAYHLPEFSDADMEDNQKSEDFNFADRDKLFDDAARLIVSTQQGSTSLIQRRMKLGYNRAGRLIDQLEAAGIVGPFEGSKAREVLVKDEMSLEQLLSELARS
ncbi:MAG TPA: DNA translocase FtsK 4TM domain-containing protein [Cytophagaceae bacterium]|nr:DNA translocase FtsK 4TM domain-containing protein [Cytophagaceae bacterium]